MVTYLSSSDKLVKKARSEGVNMYHVVPGISTARWRNNSTIDQLTPFKLLMVSSPHTKEPF